MCKSENYIKAFKPTFFNELRVKSALTIKEVAEYIGMSNSATASYFSGMIMPSDETIEKFSQLFDVDPVRAKSEFMKAHENWVAEFGKSVAFRVSEDSVKQAPVEVSSKPVEVSVDVKSAVDKNAVLQALYGKLDFKEFSRIYGYLEVDEYENVLKALYGKIGFDDYFAIASAVFEVSYGR